MDLLRQNLELHSLALLGYCLMSNHVHLILVPEKVDALGRAGQTAKENQQAGDPPAHPDLVSCCRLTYTVKQNGGCCQAFDARLSGNLNAAGQR